MASESTQHRLDRVRRPRVHITYDVEIGGAMEIRELPFIMGVLADLSGKPVEPLPRLQDPSRKFVEIDEDTFDTVMGAIQPRLAFQVDNTLTNDDSKMAVELQFNHLEDFEPEHVVQQVQPLRDLLAIRQQLAALLAKADGNDQLNGRLEDIIRNTELLQRVSQEARQGSRPPGQRTTAGSEEGRG